MLTLLTLLLLLICYIIIYFWAGISALLCALLSFVLDNFSLALFVTFIVIAIVLCL